MFNRHVAIAALAIPFIGFLVLTFAEHKQAIADIMDLRGETSSIASKLDKISEKLNQIDGKLTIIIKER
jgi:F0F1-type ATP synthase membrane subunit b/b'